MMRAAKLALITTTTVATLALVACSTSEPTDGSPTTSSTVGQAGGCEVSPATVPVPSVEPYAPVPEAGRISVAMNGIPSGVITLGGAPTEVEVTLCNNSDVDYPKVGVVLVFGRCSCALDPNVGPDGTVERFDPATNAWIQMQYPAMGGGMDYVTHFANVQELPKGKVVTLRYRVALDASMVEGNGGLSATAVTPDPIVQLGAAGLPFTVSKDSTSPGNEPARGTVLPFRGLTYPSYLAVDSGGSVYVADAYNDRVVKLAAGSNEQTVVPFTDLTGTSRVAVDAAGNLYVTDRNNRVVKLAAGSNERTVLPITDIGNLRGMAVDTAGNIYVTDGTKVVKVTAGSNDQTELPITGLKSAGGIAVDDDGTVYVNDAHNGRVVKLAAGSTDQTTLPITGVQDPDGLAVDEAGNVYVISNSSRQVLKLAAGSGDQAALPLNGLYSPEDVAVDAAGGVYVLDNSGFGQVVKSAAS